MVLTRSTYSKMDKQLQFCLREQQSIVESLTALHNLINNDPDKFSLSLDEINELKGEFKNNHKEIKRLTFELKLDDTSEILKLKQDFDNIILNILQIAPKAKPIETKPEIIHAPMQHQSITLPKININPFNGKVEDFQDFWALFNAIIHENTSISDVQKLQYLRNSLRGDPLKIISSLPLTAENYLIAYDAINLRYANPRRLANYYFNEIAYFNKFEKATFENLQNFVSVHKNSMSALEQIKNLNLIDFFKFSMAYNNLDESSRAMYENSLSYNEFPSYDKLMDFITERLRAVELLENHPASSIPCTFKDTTVDYQNHPIIKRNYSENNSAKTSYNNKSNFAKPATKVKTLLVENRPNFNCIFCHSKEHSIYFCEEFKSINVSERYKFIDGSKRCFACFGNHDRATCRSQKTCRACGSPKHNTLLHEPRKDFSNDKPQTNNHVSTGAIPKTNIFRTTTNTHNSNDAIIPQSTTSKANVTGLTNLSCVIGQRTVILGTAIVQLLDAYNNKLSFRAVLDSGSEISLITDKAVRQLNLRTTRSSQQLIGILSNCSEVNKNVNVTMFSSFKKDFEINFNALVVSKIVGNLPSTEIPADIELNIDRSQLADPHFFQSSPIDILIGADLHSQLLLNEPSILIPGDPNSLNTVFGWVLYGKVPTPTSTVNSSNTLITSLEPINNTLKKFWEIEEIDQPKIISPDDQLCENIFTSTTTRDDQGRYIVALPFKNNVTSLQSNSEIVKRHYLKFEQRLNKQLDTKIKYREFMQEYINLNHMSIALNKSNYIIPHHCVFKESSSTTKIRTVFNASYPDKSGNSLNKFLLPGPKLQSDICNILTSFRLHKFVICADIKMMYRQILVRPSDRHFQHIFYRPHDDADVIEYELNTVTYGLTPSAYLAQRTLLQLVHDEGFKYPLASNAIRFHTYVDDIITGASDLKQASKLISELINLFSLAGLELRKWSSNCSQLLNNLPQEYLESNLSFSDETSTIKILGLEWIPKSDTFSYKVLPFNEAPTKRHILSYVARTFDPLGFLTPVTFWIKHFLQILWKIKCDWDSTLPDDLINSWYLFSEQLLLLKQISIPRILTSSSLTLRLVGYCDASEKGYAAVVYLHAEINNKFSSMRIIKAKSRVAPVKLITIPRLELCAALLLSKLYESILPSFNDFNLADSRLHSDSKIVLAWLQTPTHRLQTFVANRVTQILSLTAISSWSHVPTSFNPADIASRGATPSVLLHSDIWWNGPSIHRTSFSSWPNQENCSPSEIELPDLRIEKSVLINFINIDLECFARVSTFTRLIRIFAYVLRFIHRVRKIIPSSYSVNLNTFELQNSTRFCVKLTQQFYFSKEIHSIQNNNSSLSSLQSLTPFIDTSGLLRVGGRLRNSDLSFDAKHPMLLPKKCHLSNLICDHFHHLTLHAGPRTVQSLITKQFWIISLRSLLRWRIRNCIKCLRFSLKPLQPLMADLPSSRVTSARAFHSVGIDFAGPFTVKSNLLRHSSTTKGYLCLFVCMSTKAVHLECVSELSTDAFFSAFDRFISRRGLPSDVYSDNGTNFVGAASQLRKLYEQFSGSQSLICDYMSTRQINWHFNPPSAPNFGGLWEAAVKSAKYHLHRLLGDRSFTYEEYSTLFSKIEAILNSRPLFESSSDPSEDLITLTPGHFLIGASLLQPPEHVISPHLSAKNRWLLLQHIRQTFWNQWSRHYLHTVIQRRKWTRTPANLQVGQLVLMYGLGTHPLHWPFGLVTAVHAGPDNIVRVVSVRTNHGEYKRPVNKLVAVPAF